jgi:hypothetical protein
MSDDFYVRLYIGHRGKFGHEFLELEFRPDGKLRYANNSNYKNESGVIRKEMYLSPIVMNELKRIVEDSEVSSVLALLVLVSAQRDLSPLTAHRILFSSADYERRRFQMART